ncbi:hypothetical protein V5O48_007802 [Marasmius crinis-equi]|uniref:Uncharacterized protein n=1 Tax=Marasmius crinis-equi TaxID=585013 RepID=A0ABR3FG30_9AGAR
MTALLKNMNWVQRNRPRTPNNLCENCHAKPKFVENGYQHPYCGRSCARSGVGEKPMACILDGCQNTGKRDFSYYCSKEHAKEAVRKDKVPACQGCKVYPQYQSVFCNECLHDTDTHPALPLKELNPNDTAFKQVRDEFRSAWKSKGDTAPTVEKIYEIPVARQTKARQKKFSKTISNPGETRTYFSSIYGKGIYSYRSPSCSDQFTYTVTTSPYRISVACTVIADRKHEIPERTPTFVADADGIIPVYVIMFFK